MSEYKVGAIIKVADKEVLVTRLVSSMSYFDDGGDTQPYALDELYLETLNESGEIGFVSLRENKSACERPEGPIKGPNTLEWRKFIHQEVE